MRKILILAVTAGLMFGMVGFAACNTDDPIPLPETGQPANPDTSGEPDEPANNDDNNNNNNDTLMNNQLTITVGTASFTVTLADNATSAAFKGRLPLTLEMSELNGNEKYDYLSESLPTVASNPGTIQAGDLMLYGSSCVVLFYETFRTSYSYTRIGRIDNPSGLAVALGRGSVSVTFSLQAKKMGMEL